MTWSMAEAKRSSNVGTHSHRPSLSLSPCGGFVLKQPLSLQWPGRPAAAPRPPGSAAQAEGAFLPKLSVPVSGGGLDWCCLDPRPIPEPITVARRMGTLIGQLQSSAQDSGRCGEPGPAVQIDCPSKTKEGEGKSSPNKPPKGRGKACWGRRQLH